jgi:hypothetical protein
MLTRAILRWSLIDVVQAQTSLAPVLGKGSHAAGDTELNDLAWLRELHSKIRHQKDRKPQLFRTVEVTQAHYAALQERLRERYPDRNSPDYYGNKPDVLSVKLDFLRSLTSVEALSPRHPDGNHDPEASNEDDETESLFPCILGFLDLSTLKLKHKVPARLPSPLLLRQEYKYMSELIGKRASNSGGSVIVSGQPGIGEFLVSLSHRI